MLGSGDANLKVGFPAQGKVEHIWVSKISKTESDFVRKLANNPRFLDADLGNAVSFTRDQTSDWSCTQNGTGYGNYTIRVLKNRISASQRTELDAFLRTNTVPDWR